MCITDAFHLAEVFGKGRTVHDTAAQWLSRYQQNTGEAMCEMVNFILRCTGTDLTVETEQVEDVDNVPDRIRDLQELYNEQGISEYPLISKAKKFKGFQAVLEDFFMALMQTLHHSSVLYGDEDLFENILIWNSSLSTAQCRPFRHTATLISLALMTALCDIAREVTTTVSTSRKQLENEKKKKSVNKGRVGAIQTAIQEGEKKLEAVDNFLKDGFDTVFVHRYRDIDPKIRAECMTALGLWLQRYREYFFEGQYLRYFGWTLSDHVAHTRLVIVTQLRSLYENKDNIAGLHSFTERFRQRIVEMAAQDADVSVRASAVELLDLIRNAGLLDPEDVDTVGKLVFDSEPAVRKAAGHFFVANVQDVFESTTDELGEELNEMFADEDEDDFESPKRSWLKFKCLADVLQAYDEQESSKAKSDRLLVAPRDVLSGAPIVSRFVLATEAIYPYLQELSQWQSLAGYLLYDHSQISDTPSEDDTTGMVRRLYKMEEGQEVTLLEVLCCAVKLRTIDIAKSDVDRRGRRNKALSDKIPELQEEIAHGLTQIIPQLLKKYGAVPEAASSVLRLEHLVDLDKIQDLQKDATTYSSLLNDINKQFLTHSHQDVLTEASIAFVHAKTSDELKEALETRTQELWDDLVDTLSTLSQDKHVKNADSLPSGTLTTLTNTVTRISNLASVTDCTTVLETSPSPRSSKNRNDNPNNTPFTDLIHLSNRGLRKADDDEETIKTETELVTNSIRTLLFYFMWKVQSLTTSLNAGKTPINESYFESITQNRESFTKTLISIIRQRSGLDDIRFIATTTLLDLQTLFGTLRHAGENAENPQDILTQTQNLVQEFNPETQSLIAKIHSTAERIYAKKTKRTLEPADDDDPASESEAEGDDKPPKDDNEDASPSSSSDDDDEEEEDDDADDDDDDERTTNGTQGKGKGKGKGKDKKQSAAVERLRSTILAEQRLCELTGKIVLAIIGRILDASSSSSQEQQQQKGSLTQRLLRNKSRLGHNYREVLSYLDGRKAAGGGRSKAGSTTSRKQQNGAKKDGAQGSASNARTTQTEAGKKSSNAAGGAGGKHKSSERVDDEDIEDEDDDEGGEKEEDRVNNDHDHNNVEEDGEEDLRARELIDDDDGNEGREKSSSLSEVDDDAENRDRGRDGDEDEVMGD